LAQGTKNTYKGEWLTSCVLVGPLEQISIVNS